MTRAAVEGLCCAPNGQVGRPYHAPPDRPFDSQMSSRSLIAVTHLTNGVYR